MTANQGLGAITLKDSLLLDACVQAPCATRHANGRDWWVLVSSNAADTFYRLLITPDQILGPWIQAIENPTIDSFWYCGWSEFSPDGQRFMINHCRTGTALYDFDRCTGLLSSPVLLPRVPAWDFAAAFSPNSQLLYTVTDNSYNLIQYDLLAPDIAASKTTVAQWGGFLNELNIPDKFGFIQHGPDGKLYCWAGDTQFAHIIESPNEKGTACDVRIRAITLPSYATGVNLYYPNYRLGPIDGSGCDSLGIDNLPVALFRTARPDSTDPLAVKFIDLSSYEPTAWSWSFGDGSFSTDTCPVHTYAGPGVYTVCLTVSNANGADTICQDLTVGTVSAVELPAIPVARVYPNPFGSQLVVQLPAFVGQLPVYFSMTDALGRSAVFREIRDFDTTIETAQLADGVYFWHLWLGERLVQSGRVVK